MGPSLILSGGVRMNSVLASPEKFKSNAAARGHVGVLLCCAVAAMAFTVGCVNRTDAQRLSASGLAVANSLANYYDMLGQQIDDLIEMEAFNDAIRGFPASDFRTYEVEMEKSEEAIQRRVGLARQLAATYRSLKDLSSYDASGEVSTSFNELSHALTGIPPLKSLTESATSSGPVDPTQLLSKGAGLLASWRQSRDMTQAVKSVTETFGGVDTLFGRELPAYQSISAEHVEKASVLANELITKNQVIVWPLLEQDLESIGLKLAHPDQPPSDQALAGALTAVVQVRVLRLQTLADSAGRSLLDAMTEQLAAQREFQAKQGVSTTDIQDAVENANAFLDEIAKQRQSAKQ